MFDYKSSTVWPFFLVDFKLYPSEDQQVIRWIFFISFVKRFSVLFFLVKMNFLRSYVKTLHPTMTPIEQDDLARQIMKEANFFALATNFFWTLWSIHMAVSTSIQFGYMVITNFHYSIRLKIFRYSFRNTLVPVSLLII